MKVQEISNHNFSGVNNNSSVVPRIRQLAKRAGDLYEKKVGKDVYTKLSCDEASERVAPLVLTKEIGGKKVELGIEKTLEDGTQVSLSFPEPKENFLRKVIKYTCNFYNDLTAPIKEKLESFYAVNSYQSFEKTGDVFASSKLPYDKNINIADVFANYVQKMLELV